MTLPKRSLHPAGGDDGGTFLCALEFVAGAGVQLGEVAGAVVGQRMALEPGPQVLDGIEIGCVRWQERDLDMPVETVQIMTDQTTGVRFQAIPDDQQRLLQMIP